LSDFPTYLDALRGHLLAFLSAGPFLIDRLITWFWPWGRKKLDAFPHRRSLFLWVIIVGIFYAGFLAWRDEHDAKPALIVNGAKMAFVRTEPERQDTQVEIDGEKQNNYAFRIWFRNVGALAAQPQSFNAMPMLSDKILSAQEEDTYFSMVTKQPKTSMNDNETQPNADGFYYGNYGVLSKAWDQFTNKQGYLYLFAVLTYRDDDLRGDKPISTDVCVYYSKGDLNAFRYCTSGHNKITRTH
jgi:hypothetical protein